VREWLTLAVWVVPYLTLWLGMKSGVGSAVGACWTERVRWDRDRP
jgi:hypothetical protein